MRYLYRPSGVEELVVRGRYEFVSAAGAVWGSEGWERYRNEGSPVQTWRSEWSGEQAGQRFALLSHTVVSPDGLERLKLRLLLPGRPAQQLTVTPMPDSVLVNDGETMEELALPPGYGLFAPPPSLARFAFPFDLASEQREVGMVYGMRLRLRAGTVRGRAVKFGYTPLGLQGFEVQGNPLRGRGWRMEVPGLPVQEGWFDRNGNCLLWRVEEGEQGWEARLVEWMTFG